MSAAMKLTAAQRKALLWIKRNEPVSMFPCDGTAPSIRFVKKLREIGLVDEAGKEGSRWGFTIFRLSERARNLLSPAAEVECAVTVTIDEDGMLRTKIGEGRI